MIHHKFKENIKISGLGITKEKVKKIEIALEKIARDTGEDEYEPIFILEKEINIKIKFEEIKNLIRRYIWIWVTMPYNEEIFAYLEKKLNKLLIPLTDYLICFFNNNQKFIKYPEKIEICGVKKDIFEILKERHGINSSYFNCYEWEQIQNTKRWKKAEIQIARELVADRLLSYFNLSRP